MATALSHGSTPSSARRVQIVLSAGETYRDKQAAATRDLRNKLRLACRVPYHEWERALAAGDGAIEKLLRRYMAPLWPRPTAREEQQALAGPAEMSAFLTRFPTFTWGREA